MKFFKKLEREVKRVAHQTEKHLIRPMAKAIAENGVHVSVPLPPKAPSPQSPAPRGP